MKNKQSLLLRNKSGIIHFLPLILVTGLIIAVVGYFGYQKYLQDCYAVDGCGAWNNAPALENASDEESEEVDTSDWETYVNKEHGYSFQYPAKVSKVLGPAPTVHHYQNKIATLDYRDETFGLKIYVFENDVEISENFKEFVEEWFFIEDGYVVYREFENIEKLKVFRFEEILIDGKLSYLVEADSENPESPNRSKQLDVFIKVNDQKAILLSSDTGEEEVENLKQYLDQILSTFEFVE